ncbi:unnamed protein product [Dicrocoelium dendriticum]|nr:unnamed protein product [Dicrocoelium dendriticum]
MAHILTVLSSKFVTNNGIRNIKTAPYHPASNGLAERAVQAVKQGLLKRRVRNLYTLPTVPQPLRPPEAETSYNFWTAGSSTDNRTTYAPWGTDTPAKEEPESRSSTEQAAEDVKTETTLSPYLAGPAEFANWSNVSNQEVDFSHEDG